MCGKVWQYKSLQSSYLIAPDLKVDNVVFVHLRLFVLDFFLTVQFGKLQLGMFVYVV